MVRKKLPALPMFLSHGTLKINCGDLHQNHQRLSIILKCSTHHQRTTNKEWCSCTTRLQPLLRSACQSQSPQLLVELRSSVTRHWQSQEPDGIPSEHRAWSNRRRHHPASTAQKFRLIQVGSSANFIPYKSYNFQTLKICKYLRRPVIFTPAPLLACDTLTGPVR